jgi:hypothetical protein
VTYFLLLLGVTEDGLTVERVLVVACMVMGARGLGVGAGGFHGGYSRGAY